MTLHQGFKLEARYWAYLQGHPNHIACPKNAYDRAFASLTWCNGDMLSFPHSTAPYPHEVSSKLLTILESLHRKPHLQPHMFITGLMVVFSQRFYIQPSQIKSRSSGCR